ncbi:hypothetical protein KKH43_02690 [Patescibacteria group bacterium]|nr:hypothetical protein [Patescibacteria group bacterium]
MAKTLKFAIGGCFSIALVAVALSASAASGNNIQPAAEIDYLEPVNVQSAIKVDKTGRFLESIHVGSTSPGVGGVFFVNGTLRNVAKNSKGEDAVPVTIGDDLRVDGKISRLGDGGTYPIKVADTIMPTGSYDLGTATNKFQNGKFSDTVSADQGFMLGTTSLQNPPTEGVMQYDGDNLFFRDEGEWHNLTEKPKVTPDNLQTSNNPTNGQVLSIQGGTFTWTTIGSSPWIVSGNNIYYNTGNVGIGTATPAHPLDVAGTIQGQHVLPVTNDTYDLGSTSQRWANLYLGGDTIDMAGYDISNPGLRLAFNGSGQDQDLSIANTQSYPDPYGYTYSMYADASRGGVGFGLLDGDDVTEFTAVDIGSAMRLRPRSIPEWEDYFQEAFRDACNAHPEREGMVIYVDETNDINRPCYCGNPSTNPLDWWQMDGNLTCDPS